SKTEIWRRMGAHLARAGARFGVVTGPVTTDMATVVKRKRDMVQREIDAHLHNYKTTGAELIMGSGRFVAPKTLEVHLNDGGTRVLAGDRVFINVGTHAAIPPGSRSRGGPATHPHRGPRARLPPFAPDRVGGRLRRPRTSTGLSPVRQPRDRDRAWSSADGAGGSRRGGRD